MRAKTNNYLKDSNDKDKKSKRHKNACHKKTLNLKTVCSCHVTYAFQSESTLYSCLNVKELLAQSRREIWSLGDYNWTRTHNHLVWKRTLNYLAKLASDSKILLHGCLSHFLKLYKWYQIAQTITYRKSATSAQTDGWIAIERLFYTSVFNG